MKSKIIKLYVVTFVLSIVTSCSSTLITTTKGTPAKNLPPGKAKKVSGDKSAKKHAPGQKKKKK